MSAEDNKALVRRFIRAQWQKDFVALKEMMAPDFVDQSVIPGQGSTREYYLQDVAEDQAASSGARLSIEDQMAEDDRVMSRLTIRDSNDQEMFTGIIINRVVGGEITEEWSEGTYMYELTQKRLDHELRERERVDQELRVARRIQQALLPKELPPLDDWDIAPYYQPARDVGGDFYDFLSLSEGRVGVIIDDVSSKGIAAALVMANTQSVLRAVAQGSATPGGLLAQVNTVLWTYIPSNIPEHEMLGSPRLKDLLTEHAPGAKHLIRYVMEELVRFTGEGWEQEDDITLVALQHHPARAQA